jgi:hypothetical protein
LIRFVSTKSRADEAVGTHKILLEFKDLLADLCSYRDYLCTNAKSRMQMPTKTAAR